MATMKEIQEYEAKRVHSELCLKSDIHFKVTLAIEESLSIAGISKKDIAELGLRKKVDDLSKSVS